MDLGKTDPGPQDRKIISTSFLSFQNERLVERMVKFQELVDDALNEGWVSVLVLERVSTIP